jgi:predicted RNase H-like HicB family nuclease
MSFFILAFLTFTRIFLAKTDMRGTPYFFKDFLPGGCRDIQKGRNYRNYSGEDNMQKQLTAIIEREGNGYVSLCPELDIASQGDTIEEARKNLQEALELFFETASPIEIQTRLHEEVYVTRVDVAVG